MNIKIKINNVELIIENLTETTLGYSHNDILKLLENFIINYNLIK